MFTSSYGAHFSMDLSDRPLSAQSKLSCRERLEGLWKKWSQLPIDDSKIAAALTRLEAEVDQLVNAGQRWVNREMTRFGDPGNYQSYCLEVHFASGFLAAGLHLEHDVRFQEPDNKSDIDFVLREESTSFNFEVVCVNEWEKTWTEVAVAKGVTLFGASWDGDDEAGQIRRLQDKLRIKTVRDGLAWKFPEPQPGLVNILVADVSGVWMKNNPDYWDLALTANGCRVVPSICRRSVIGLFETVNEFGPDADEELESNRFFRERVHAILFLLDQSSWKSSLNPEYHGMLVTNRALVDDPLAEHIVNVVSRGMLGWVPRWLAEPSLSEELRQGLEL